MIYVETKNYVEMDAVHINLIKSTAMALKARDMLELGIGSGKVTTALLEASMATGYGQVTVVDNWIDWGGAQPPTIHGAAPYIFVNRLQTITQSEKDFIEKQQGVTQFDLIVSDADHQHSHEWWRKTMALLKYGGVAFFHDVCNKDFPKLNTMVYDIDAAGYHTKIFNASSHPFERCERGLLMAWKD
mgnify:CR=1 FL=1